MQGGQKHIKVLLAVCNNVLNGTERYVVDLAKNLSKERFDVYVATPAYGPLSEILKEAGIKEIIFNNERLKKYSIKGIFNMAGIIRKGKFDVVHANAGIWPCLPARFLGVKLIIEVKHGIFYSIEQLESMSFLRKAYEKSKKFFVHKFIATSENDKRIMMKYFNIKEKMIGVIYLGLDFEALYKKVDPALKPAPFDKNNIVIGHIGRLTYQKSQGILLKAINMLKSVYPSLKLYIFGEGEDKEELTKYVREHNLQHIVFFKGYTKDVYNTMLGFNMHVLTSRYEGMGYVNLEAMALGIPVVTSDVGGATNFLRNGENALITAVGDHLSTAEAVKKLIEDENLRNRIIETAKEDVKYYNVARMAAETEKLYLENLCRF